MKRLLTQSVITTFLLCLVSITWAGNVTIPNTFSSGTKAKAAEVNTNFSAVKTEVDDNNTRIMSLENLWIPLGIDLHSGVTGSVYANDFSYTAAQTRYLQLAGGQCVYPSGTPAGFARNVFYCDLGDNSANTAEAYWTVNVPHGATLLGMRVRLYTSIATTTCTLTYGRENTGTQIAAVTESFASGVTNNWHYANEVTFSHTVDTENNAYGIMCRNNDTGGAAATVIGSIRIRYTVDGPN